MIDPNAISVCGLVLLGGLLRLLKSWLCFACNLLWDGGLYFGAYTSLFTAWVAATQFPFVELFA
jgi:hypothetical protein